MSKSPSLSCPSKHCGAGTIVITKLEVSAEFVLSDFIVNKKIKLKTSMEKIIEILFLIKNILTSNN